ncbi:Putative glycosyltransferase EpsE [Roseovarius gaetbuli]|uniref:Putative glycosyltransferase EpsE n=1 Tax=Roseovarius gaetbuli TaxID=1356575 RepID=A0A1X7A430_9RHOB|nr:glycosyltransferase [Roseovarius gaetbuli]SLN69913.1 Putative glycosyltransferase EpsE [Roseovarius gaetbuli]
MPRQSPHITIFLCTFNSARYLDQQLESYLAQTHTNWSLWVSDDGSVDATHSILNAFAREHGAAHEVRLFEGPRRGRAAQNFLSLLMREDRPQGLVALSDHDDIWLPDKLERAAQALDAHSQAPQLYSAMSRCFDDTGRPQALSHRRVTTLNFGVALLHNVMAGHNMVLNPAAQDLVRRAGAPQDIPYHDWWISLVVLGAGGEVVFDHRVVTLYRQHADNEMGASRGLRAAYQRVRALLAGHYATWVRANATALLDGSAKLTEHHHNLLVTFLRSSTRSGFRRVTLFRKLGLRRHGRVSTGVVYVLAFLGRV